MKALKITAIACTMIFAASSLAEDDPGVEVKRAKTELALKEEAAGLKKKCGISPKMVVDWKSFPKDFGNYSISGYCESVTDALWSHCETKAKRTYIKKKVKQVTCGFAPKGKGRLEAKSGTIKVMIDFEMSNHGDWVKKELLRSL